MVLREGTHYTFSQILEQNSETEEILADLGYRYRNAPLTLQSKEVPRFAAQIDADARADAGTVALCADDK